MPTMSSTKQQMKDWLTSKAIEFPDYAMKGELLQLIVANCPTPNYAVDEMAKASGYEVVRLRPYHCELNHRTGMVSSYVYNYGCPPPEGSKRLRVFAVSYAVEVCLEFAIFSI